MNSTHKGIFRVFLIVFVGVFFAACGAKKAEKVTIIIPKPPEEPRIFYIDTYHGGKSFIESRALDLFIGEDQGGASGNLYKPYGVHSVGNMMYVSDTAIGNVFAFDLLSKNVSFIGDKQEGKLAVPAGIAHDSSNNIYVSDAKQMKVYGYTPEGNLMFEIGKKNEFRRPSGLAINKKLKRLYVVDTKAHNVKAYSLDGKALFQFGKRGSGAGEFNFPTNIAIDQISGNLIIADTQNFRIQIFDKDGEFIKKFGEIGDRAGAFARPKGVGVDSEGHIYVADAAFNRVQIFDQKGNLMLFFGGHGMGPGSFLQVAGLYVDDNDKIYIVDNMGRSVEVYQYISKKWKAKNPQKYNEIKNTKLEKLTQPKKPKKEWVIEKDRSSTDIIEQTPGKGKLKEGLLNF